LSYGVKKLSRVILMLS